MSKSMKWMFILLLFIVCVFIVYTYSNDKGRILDRMTNAGPSTSATFGNVSSGNSMGSSYADSTAVPMAQKSTPMAQQSAPMAQQSAPMAQQSAPMMMESSVSDGYNMQPVANPSDLLPQDQNSQWANLNPLNGSIPVPVDLLQAGYQIGLDTIGQTLKNANYQLRSDPIIEKKDVGPWMQSTIEPDYGRIPLEIGMGGR